MTEISDYDEGNHEDARPEDEGEAAPVERDPGDRTRLADYHPEDESSEAPAPEAQPDEGERAE